MFAGPVYILPIEPVTISDDPVIEQGDVGSTVTILLHAIEEQPFNVVVNVSVKLPAAPAVIFTDEPVVDPIMVPLPLIDQL